MSVLKFNLNGTHVELSNPDPTWTLIQYLRSVNLTGTKLGCAEGGCGACTVQIEDFNGPPQAVNSCLALLCNMNGKSITTCEGVGTTKKPHHIQKLIAKCGSQCGYCTPGFVMSAYTYSQNPQVDIENVFDGNLCRCTGYIPILEAMDEVKQVEKQIQYEDGVISNVEQIFTKNNHSFFLPNTVASLLELYNSVPNAKLVAGNTEIGIEVKFKGKEYINLISTKNVKELEFIREEEKYIEFGSGVTLTQMRIKLESYVLHTDKNKMGFRAILDSLKWFAGNQIRNVATWAGNIATGSPISDLSPTLLALDCSLVLMSVNGKRIVKMDEFFIGYRTNALNANEILYSLSKLY